MSYDADNPAGGATAVGEVPSPDPALSRSVPPAGPRRRGRTDRLGWVLVAVLIVVQWGMFRQFCLREVVWSYPPYHDQLNYLTETYGGYELTLDAGAREGLEASAGFAKPVKAQRIPGEVILPGAPERRPDFLHGRSAVGILLPLQATILYFIAGPGRMTALSLNLFYFALFQCMLVATLRSMTGRWSVALIGLGLLLAALTPFMWAGGIVDFRFDFGGFCLFGAFLCAVFRSGLFTDRRWSVIAGAFGATLFLLRFLTIVYLGGILGLLGAFLLLRLRWSSGVVRERRVAQVRNALIACGVILAVAVPVLIQRFPSIKAYYVIGHVTGPEGKMRSLEQGVTDLKSDLLFYPTSLIVNHAGYDLLKCAAALLILGLVLRLLRARQPRGTARFDVAAAAVLVLAALVVPLAALTLDSNKSPVVANIMVGPLIWAVLLAFVATAGLWSSSTLTGPLRWVLGAVAAGVLCVGLSNQCAGYSSRTSMSHRREKITRLLDLYDRLGTMSFDMGWRTPRFAFNTTSDSVNYRAFQVREFEQTGRWFDPSEVLAGTIFDRTAKDSLDRMRSADFAILSEIPPPAPGAYELPFDRDMRRVTPELVDWCRANMIELWSGPLMDKEAHAFVRPAVRVRGEADGWIARSGATVTSLAQILRRRPTVELWGPSSAAELARPPHVEARLTAAGAAPVRVPAQLKYEGAEYHMTLLLDPSTIPDSGKVTIELSFDSAFTPPSDPRELVFKLPDRAELHEPADRR